MERSDEMPRHKLHAADTQPSPCLSDSASAGCQAYTCRLKWVYGRSTSYEDPCPEEDLEYSIDEYQWLGRKPKHMTIRETMDIICDTMRTPSLAIDTDFMIISWRIIAVWVRLDKFQVVCHEQELLIFGSDRLDATMTSAEYTQSIFVACWR